MTEIKDVTFFTEFGNRMHLQALIRPECGVKVRRPQKGWVAKLAPVLLFVVAAVLSVLISIKAAIAAPQYSDNRIKAFNSAAQADLSNMKSCFEGYYANHLRYPVSLQEIAAAECGRLTDEVKMYALMTSENFALISYHLDGDLAFMTTSDSLEITNQSKVGVEQMLAADFQVVDSTGNLSVIVVSQHSPYRIKAFNSGAQADLRNMKVCFEGYYVDHLRYPVSLQEIAAAECGRLTTGVKMYVLATAEKVKLISYHPDGDLAFMTTSDSSEITNQPKAKAEQELAANFQVVDSAGNLSVIALKGKTKDSLPEPKQVHGLQYKEKMARGERGLALWRWEEASWIFRNILKSYPDDPAAKAGLAKAQAELQRIATLVERLEAKKPARNSMGAKNKYYSYIAFAVPIAELSDPDSKIYRLKQPLVDALYDASLQVIEVLNLSNVRPKILGWVGNERSILTPLYPDKRNNAAISQFLQDIEKDEGYYARLAAINASRIIVVLQLSDINLEKDASLFNIYVFDEDFMVFSSDTVFVDINSESIEIKKTFQENIKNILCNVYGKLL